MWLEWRPRAIEKVCEAKTKIEKERGQPSLFFLALFSFSDLLRRVQPLVLPSPFFFQNPIKTTHPRARNTSSQTSTSLSALSAAASSEFSLVFLRWQSLCLRLRGPFSSLVLLFLPLTPTFLSRKKTNNTQSPILPPRQGRLPGDVQARGGRRARGDGQRARPRHLPRAVVAGGPAQADGPGAGEDSGLGRGRVREEEVLRRARHWQREGE